MTNKEATEMIRDRYCPACDGETCLIVESIGGKVGHRFVQADCQACGERVTLFLDIRESSKPIISHND